MASEEAPTYGFDEPVADDRQSWAMPAGHGSYRGLELELLHPADEDDLMLLLDAQHAELADALDSGQEMIVEGEPFSPRLHLAMHQIVANQLLADDPPETWQRCNDSQAWVRVAQRHAHARPGDQRRCCAGLSRRAGRCTRTAARAACSGCPATGRHRRPADRADRATTHAAAQGT